MAIHPMTTRQKIQRYLQTFDFVKLFIDILGWDYLKELPLPISFENHNFSLRPLVEKRGVKVYICNLDTRGNIVANPLLRKIEREVIKHAYEHIIIYTDREKTTQVWQWVKREQGKPSATRLHRYYKGQSGEGLAQKLEALVVAINEEDQLRTLEVMGRVTKAFDVERVTKKFYDRFKLEHTAFLQFITGITAQGDREWYASLMLNRLMFIYFIQRKGFLDTKSSQALDGDSNYLANRLKWVKQQRGEDQFQTFYRYFLLKLFHDGLSKRENERSPELQALLGNIPYLNGGLFDVHTLESAYQGIDIPDEAFEKLFRFFNEFEWHLDNRPLRNDKEINPDVLGYIFEKYINQKQMGAYYTKRTLTGYISQNTVLPFLLDAAARDCAVAFQPGSAVWRLLQDDPDRYIYDAVRQDTGVPLPLAIAAGIGDVSQREGWNRPADQEYALPTETWREHVARRQRYEELRAKLAAGEVHAVNDLITYNLDIERFALDVVRNCEGPDLLRAFYFALAGRIPLASHEEARPGISILDPTCGSGAFLFAALNILQPLYAACLDRMEAFVADFDRGNPTGDTQQFKDFRTILAAVAEHPNEDYFILKSIIVNNLFGVDIMEEAVEIAKLRLFLKLIAQVDKDPGKKNFGIEPLPDIDFNIRAGNTLVGFATLDEARRAIGSKFDWDNTMARIEEQAADLDRLFARYRAQQTIYGGVVTVADKAELRRRAEELEGELNRYLAQDYGVDPANTTAFEKWLSSHRPFHWFLEFYGTIQQHGGFDVMIGNPPYVEFRKVRQQYTVRNLTTESCGNLYALVLERSIRLAHEDGRVGMIVPIASVSTEGMRKLQDLYMHFPHWHSHYAVRPGKLFVGVDMNLTITLLQKSQARSRSLTTTYRRWFNGLPSDRACLFSTLAYVENPRLPAHTNPFPKLGCEMEKSILRQMLRHGHKLQRYVVGSGSTVYYHSGGRYWRKALPDKLSSHYKPITVNADLAPIVFCILNSQLFYWYWISNSNCMDVVSREVLDLPVFPLASSDEAVFSRLMRALFDSYYSSNTTRQRRGVRINVEEINFDVQQAKPIIDEIDRALAQRYGFTDEELDFIVNYDIKYRMGRDAQEDGVAEQLETAGAQGPTPARASASGGTVAAKQPASTAVPAGAARSASHTFDVAAVEPVGRPAGSAPGSLWDLAPADPIQLTLEPRPRQLPLVAETPAGTWRPGDQVRHPAYG